MATVIPVRFSYAARDLWFDPGETGAQEGDHVICSTERGTEIGLATAQPLEVSTSELNNKTNNAALKPVLRIASEGDLERAAQLAQLGEEAMPTFRRLVAESELDMKPVGVEYLFGRERVVCYFAAEERVDFRQLVRSLSHELHERIDMRQIGVREEAAHVGGFGHCGQELCCSRFGLSFDPVSIRMAKEQDLPLTSNKISGACGRLMCCLRYEFEAYRDFKGRAPKRNAVIDTPLGKAKIVEYDTPKEQLVLRIENGKTVRVPLGEMVASETAVKKSEELHCPCRPDTVLRESLDKLSSPDVQMALAELDRKMGVIVDDEPDTTDLFVETKPRRRRSRKSGENNVLPQAASQPQPQGEASAPKPSRRRRRRSAKSATADAATNASAQKPNQSAQAEAQGVSAQGASQPEKRTRRRRRRSSATNAAAAQQTPETQAKETAAPAGEAKEGASRRRRRRRSSAKPAETAGNDARNAPGAQQGKKDKPKRRPGDRAGQASQAQQAGQAQQAQTEGAAPKRRRRRRGRRGGGAGSNDTTQAPKTE